MCSDGFYSGDNAEYCTNCPSGYWSTKAASGCYRAAEGYFWDTKKSKPKPCPRGVDCTNPGTTTENMKLDDHFYKFGNESVKVYKCPYEANCIWPSKNGAVGQSLCIEGSFGPLCSVCHPDHFMSSSKDGCVKCADPKGSAHATLGPWLGPWLGFVVVVILGAALVKYWDRLRKRFDENNEWWDNFIQKGLVWLVFLVRMIH